MLGIGKLAAGAEDYYLNVAQGIEDYYVGVSAPGRWIGSTSQLLGVDGDIEPGALKAVFAGLDATTNTPLLSSANRTVVAFDLTYKADKTVSLLHALATPDVAEAIEAAHAHAVDASVRYLEAHAVHTRRGRNGIETLRGDGLVAASFRHYRNRNDEPHLHEHVLVPNMVRADDGRWSTLDARHLYHHAKTAGYVYQADLRDQLTRTLGLRFGPVTSGVAPIDGIDRTVVDAFSTRRAEILEHLDTVGATSARAAQIATLQTRRAKDPAADVAAIRAQWDAKAREHGLDRDRFPELLGRVQAAALTDAERTAATTRLLSPAGLTEHAATFDRRDLLRAWCEAHPQGAPLSELELLSAQMIASEPQLVALRGERWTTKDLLDCEQRILDQATSGAARGIAVVPKASISAALKQHPTASSEQVQVARSLLSNGDAISVLIAPAGAGKGFTLGIANQAWQDAGVPVLGATIAARAAAELHNGAGIASTTITELLANLDDGRPLPPGAVLVIDEAGMVGTRQLARLVTHASRQSAKVVLVGDPRQLPEIDAGGVLGGLATRVPVLTLTENRRQREAWERAALREFRNGSVDAALETLDSHGRIERAATLADVRTRIIDQWSAARANGEEAIILASRRDDVRALNQLARERIAEQLRQPTILIEGAAFQIGDTVMTLRNNKRLGVRNGERGTLAEINPHDRSATVRMNGRAILLPASYLDAGHLTHGYAMTVHKAQGLTVDRTFVLGTDDLYREMGYVAMSRGRNGNHLFIVGEPTREIEPVHGPSLERDAEELLAASLATSRAQTLATTQTNPLATTPDATLAAEYRELVAYRRSIPADASRRLSELRQKINDHDQTIATLEQQQAEARSQRRPARDVLARRDDRGRQEGYRIASTRRFRDELIPERDRLTNDQQRRQQMLEQRPDLNHRIGLLDAEINRRVEQRVDVLINEPEDYLTRTLGNVPADGNPRRATWRNGARLIERNRFERNHTSTERALPNDHNWELDLQLRAVQRELDGVHRSRGMGRGR